MQLFGYKASSVILIVFQCELFSEEDKKNAILTFCCLVEEHQRAESAVSHSGLHTSLVSLTTWFSL